MNVVNARDHSLLGGNTLSPLFTSEPYIPATDKTYDRDTKYSSQDLK